MLSKLYVNMGVCTKYRIYQLPNYVISKAYTVRPNANCLCYPLHIVCRPKHHILFL